MNFKRFYEIFPVFFFIIAAFLSVKVLFPLCMPFLMGGLLSLTAEPFVRFGCKNCHLKRPFSAFLGVSLTLAIVLCATVFLGGLAVREVRSLTRFLPQLQQTAENGIATLEDSLLDLSARLPESIRNTARNTIYRTFSQEEGLLTLSARLPELAAKAAGKVPAGALSVGTGILSGFLISVRLPKLKAFFANRIPAKWRRLWGRLKGTLAQWLKAQGKLMGITFAIVTGGLLILDVPYAPVWAAVAAAVDAVPLLGTGVMLLPWAVVKWMQGDTLTALGLGCIYAVAAVTRMLLEPRLVGKQLGLDPLAALVVLYVGFRLWGVWGLVLAPIGAAVIKTVALPQDKAS